MAKLVNISLATIRTLGGDKDIVIPHDFVLFMEQDYWIRDMGREVKKEVLVASQIPHNLTAHTAFFCRSVFAAANAQSSQGRSAATSSGSTVAPHQIRRLGAASRWPAMS